ncbi:hypothetical protein TRIUR3_30488 [Triticum urartu]|uniref:Uncharacterized protein n=1 Tax=Triticum urartu TaxID=4572 RepID=M7Z9Q5_TRIUA|nr:hypothetical protein TRIUR3_30488 [Triticum urartu]
MAHDGKGRRITFSERLLRQQLDDLTKELIVCGRGGALSSSQGELTILSLSEDPVAMEPEGPGRRHKIKSRRCLPARRSTTWAWCGREEQEDFRDTERRLPVDVACTVDLWRMDAMDDGPNMGAEDIALKTQRVKQPVHVNIKVRVLPYRAMLADGAEEQMERQDIEMQIRWKGLTLNKFAYDLSQYIPWGPWQEVHLFGYDKDSDEECRLFSTKQLRSHLLDHMWGEEEKVKMLVEVHTKPAKKSAAKRANKPTKEPAAKKPKKAPVEKAPKILKSAMDDVLCSATSSVVVDNANEEALEVVQPMASQTSAFVDNDINFATCDVVQPNMPSISDIAESNEQCGSSVVLDIEPPIDWSLIEIAPPNEDEVDVPVTEENMCDFLGIEEDETHEAPSSPPSEDAYLTDEEDQQLLTEAAIPVDDKIAQEEEIAYDKENPRMKKQRAITYPAEDDEPGPQIGGAPIGTPNRQIGGAPLGTPNRQMLTIPASLHDSLRPVTRRMLAMALDDESSEPTEMPSTSRETLKQLLKTVNFRENLRSFGGAEIRILRSTQNDKSEAHNFRKYTEPQV